MSTFLKSGLQKRFNKIKRIVKMARNKKIPSQTIFNEFSSAGERSSQFPTERNPGKQKTVHMFLRLIFG